MADISEPEKKIGLNDAKSYLKERDEKLYDHILGILEKDGPQTVLLAGEAGIGKTRLAKKVAEHATSKKLCFLTLCLHLNKKFEDEWSLYENIASQLSVYSDFEETEVDDRDEDEEDEKKPDELLHELKKDIIDEISKKFPKKNHETDEKNAERKSKNQPAKSTATEAENKDSSTTKKQYLLLILDDDINKTRAVVVMNDLKLKKFLTDMLQSLPVDKDLKIIVTRRKREEKTTEAGGKIESQDTKSLQGSEEQEEEKSDGEIVPALEDKDNERKSELKSQETEGENSDPPTVFDSSVPDAANELLKTIDERYLQYLFASLIPEDLKIITDSDCDDDHPRVYANALDVSHIVKRSKNSPAAVFVLAKSLSWIMQSTSDEEKKRKLKEMIYKKTHEILSAHRFDPSEPDSSEGAINPILNYAYELLETYVSSKSAILDCFWHSLDFFEHCGCVYYRDLITQWILEGYFDPVRSVEKAYQDGHSILMELINRGMLKIQENNVVVPEMAMSNIIDPRRRGHLGRSRLGFSRVYRGDKKKGIGKITPIDDMIKTVQAKKGDKITTILVSGDRLRRETPKKYFAKLGDLEVLGLFEPTVDPFIKSFSDSLKLLRVLVIRDCDLLKSIEELKTLKKLNALEVSGASSLKKIPDEFFKAFLELQSLHLSGLQITSSPSSISELKELHCLIIKDCPLLEDLPDIQELVKLEVVDISGARGLQTCFDNTKGDKKNKSKNKNFYHLTKLQLLDFSESQIERLPIFQDSAVAAKLHSLTRLLLRNCSKLRRLPSLKPLSGLQILDLSGTTRLVEMLEVCFEDKKELKTLNLSGTNLSELATTIEELSGLNKLLLKNCTNLEVLPNIERLTNLEVFDASGSTKLHTIHGSFKDMSYLRDVNLYGTKVETLELPDESKIHCLKRIILADGKSFEGGEWSQIKEDIERERSENASSSDAVVKSQEISEEFEETGKIQLSEPRAIECTEKSGFCKERLLQVPIERALYKKTLSLFDCVNQQEGLEINETNELDGNALAIAEVVSFVDCSPTRLTSIFKETKLMKSCWLRMCVDIKELFSGMDKEHLGSLATLSIRNLPFLETITCGGSFTSLKKLSIDYCPNIKTIFSEASHMPSSLEVLHIKYCEKLEKVFKEGEVSTDTNLKELSIDCCPSIITIFPEASQLPSSLKVLNLKYCEKLEKLFKEGEVSTLTSLCLVELPVLSSVAPKLPDLKTFKKKNCPKFSAEMEDLKVVGA